MNQPTKACRSLFFPPWKSAWHLRTSSKKWGAQFNRRPEAAHGRELLGRFWRFSSGAVAGGAAPGLQLPAAPEEHPGAHPGDLRRNPAKKSPDERRTRENASCGGQVVLFNMFFSSKIKGNRHLQGNVQVYNVRIPVYTTHRGREGLGFGFFIRKAFKGKARVLVVRW